MRVFALYMIPMGAPGSAAPPLGGPVSHGGTRIGGPRPGGVPGSHTGAPAARADSSGDDNSRFLHKHSRTEQLAAKVAAKEATLTDTEKVEKQLEAAHAALEFALKTLDGVPAYDKTKFDKDISELKVDMEKSLKAEDYVRLKDLNDKLTLKLEERKVRERFAQRPENLEALAAKIYEQAKVEPKGLMLLAAHRAKSYIGY